MELQSVVGTSCASPEWTIHIVPDSRSQRVWKLIVGMVVLRNWRTLTIKERVKEELLQ
jgi:hypothetical protein